MNFNKNEIIKFLYYINFDKCINDSNRLTDYYNCAMLDVILTASLTDPLLF